jgi:branched-chain amino acid transport system substrate-binding protein
MKNWKRAAALVALVALVAGACGDSDDDADEAGATTSAGDGATTTAAADTTAAPETTGATETTGGAATTGAGAAEGEPILVGWHNLEGGVISLPEIREGFETAVDYINTELGGVNGRPIEVLVCNVDGSPESSVGCANQFVENDVVTAAQGVDIGGDALLPILAEAGVAEVGWLPFGPQQRLAVGDAFFFGSASPSFAMSSVLALQELGAQKIEFIFQDVPSAHSYQDDVIAPLAEELGLEINTQFYDPAAPDWATITATAMASQPDAIGSPAIPEPDCVGMVTALKAANYTGDIWGAGCSVFIDVLGPEVAQGVYTYADVYIPDVMADAPPEVAEELQTYVDLMTAAGLEDKIEGFAQGGFGVAMDLYTALSQMEGDIDSTTFLEHMQTATGRRFMGQDFNCDGSAWPGETACQVGVIIYQVGPDGNRVMASDGFADISEYVPTG